MDENVDVEHFSSLLVQEVVALKNEINVYHFCASTVLMMYTNLHLWLVTIA